uniref:FAD-dependent oxidoreductase n=1 Tax=Desertifilum tharense IPPAS B-1220 TaxID=1781255 RepID=A0ACD5GX94_9CYAN
MLRVTIVGCGAVGAAIAYELSQVSGLEVVVLDRQFPLPPESNRPGHGNRCRPRGFDGDY